MFACSQMGGTDLGFPDVCKTPSPPSGVIPIPYPNTSPGPTAAPPAVKVFFGGTPAHNMTTKGTASVGDQPGVAGGVASGTTMGPNQKLTAAFPILVQAIPATKMTSATGQNGASLNTPGVALAPAQVKVLLLK